MKCLSVFSCITLLVASAEASAADISTHVLDLARGVGGRDIAVTLSKQQKAGDWIEVARARTGENGRVASFGDSRQFQTGLYKLTFDMSAYPNPQSPPFFPEIDLVFRVTDADAHYHVPVVVSPYGYSTYRGN
ncbi:hydroxyisourate hydrolase [Sphingomonas sp. KC8]|uniref:hydroxyisourate hydrolase n=1 Tax=Sphingomonas sp. KC8 TaxID=1030157 RepID=UPI00024893D6|nr:hydroxyisourate hydrolase [Sphingomonas sp. KC8]ARS26782.1 hypothetical protein KC8_05715 [Sphingomonas sp. KC8]